MVSHLPDELLARRAAAGNLEDFEELLRRYRKRVYSLCYRMAGNREDAEDWAQECFVRVHRQLAHYDSRLPFTPWLLRVVSNACINLAKAGTARQGKTDMRLDEEPAIADISADPMHLTLPSNGVGTCAACSTVSLDCALIALGTAFVAWHSGKTDCVMIARSIPIAELFHFACHACEKQERL